MFITKSRSMLGARGKGDRFVETAEKTLAEPITGACDYHPPERGDIRKGVLLSVENDKALVDMGVKCEAIVPKKDLELLGEAAVSGLAAGDEVSVYVMTPEDRAGNVLVSLRRAQQEADWTRAEELLESRPSGRERG